MEKFFKLFRRDLQTQRLELRILEPTPENAKLIWDAIKDENPNDFKFIHYSPKYLKTLPESESETLETMKQEAADTANNGVIWYVFHNGKLIGHHGMFYFDSNDSAQGGNIWFKKSAQGHGFNKEIYSLLEKMVFEQLKANRFARACDEFNINSKKCILGGGFHQDGHIRGANKHPDGTYSAQLVFTKLASEYKQK